MHGCIPAALHKFQHPTSQRPQHSLHHWNRPNYVAPNQLTSIIDTSAPLPPYGIHRIPKIIGTLLYYARAVDNTLIVALGKIFSAQSKGTVATAEATLQLLNYCSMNTDSCIRYKAISMVLYIHSNASYLSYPQSHSRSSRHL